ESVCCLHNLLRVRFVAVHIAKVFWNDRLPHPVLCFVRKVLLSAVLVRHHAAFIDMAEDLRKCLVVPERASIMRRLPGDRVQTHSKAFFEAGFQFMVNGGRVAVGSGFVGERIPKLEVVAALSMQLVSHSVKHDLSALFDHVAQGFNDVWLIRKVLLDAAGRVAENRYECHLERYSPPVQKIGYSTKVLWVAVRAYIFDADQSSPLRSVLLSKDVVQGLREYQRTVAFCVVSKYRIGEIPE